MSYNGAGAKEMATSVDFIEFVCAQIRSPFPVRYRKMFGEYLVYVHDKPVLLVCDNCAYVKKLPQIADLLGNAPTGTPYAGTKEHYILDLEDPELVEQVVAILESVTPLPQKRRR
ncbi:MAG: transcriptional regulator [Prevotella sp.]|nr:transcriptional regulator [Prevotella sp.]